jgi:hypothetical protein
MNRSIYFNYIEERLSTLSTSIERRGSLNLLEYNIHSEDFFTYFLNNLFNWKLINLNEKKQNADAVDLYDDVQQMYVQVSATSSKQKIEKSLNSDFFIGKSCCHFMFLCLTNNVKNLQTSSYSNPHNVSFDPINDIMDLGGILRKVKSLNITKMKIIFDLVKSELGVDSDIKKFNSNISIIIEILSQVNLSMMGSKKNIHSFDIDRKITHNKLHSTRIIIEENSTYCYSLDKKYKEFDRLGSNKSLAILNTINKHYISAITTQKYQDSDELLIGLINELIDDVKCSSNCPDIPIEELEFCVCIIVVDAFLRCKIFENPGGYDYAFTR